MRCHSTFQRSCDEDDPQHQSNPQWEEKGKVESADGVHGPVIQAQEEQQIRHADPWENESCRGDKSCDEEQEKARDSGGILRIEKIRGKKPQCGDCDQTKDDIPGDPPGEPSGAGLPDDQRHAACHSADEEVEHRHGIPLDELQERTGKHKYAKDAAHGEDHEKNQISLFVFHKRTYGRDQPVVNPQDHCHGAATHSGDQHGASDDQPFEGGEKIVVFSAAFIHISKTPFLLLLCSLIVSL